MRAALPREHRQQAEGRDMRVLGIETSCDETGVAVYDSGAGLLAHRLHSQVAMHADYGGVVPELASRDHVRRAVPLVREVVGEAGLAIGDLDGVAYTAGPGLMGALLVGAGLGRSLAFSLGVPAVGVHHMEAHLLAPRLEADAPAFPFVALLVSGGHTMLVDVEGVGRYRLLGESVDDAVGEAFDKTAKLLGLGYPGGPRIEALAAEGGPSELRFPRPMLDRPGLEFSFSGLKTSVLTALEKAGGELAAADIAWAFQEAVADTLVEKSRRALAAAGRERLVVAGGVGANRRLRSGLQAMAGEAGATVHFPRPAFCTDNGAMVAYAGWVRLAAGQGVQGDGFQARARWPLAELGPA